MSAESYLKDLQSDDPSVVRAAAKALGALKDKAYVDYLIAAFGAGGWRAFEKVPQDSINKRCFGAYRDKIITLAGALWMIGDKNGIEAASRMLRRSISEGEMYNILPSEHFTTEHFLLQQFERGKPHFDGWEEISVRKPKKGGCFIATAAMGTPHCQEIETLYRWRDDVLVHSKMGRLFVDVYYLVSPVIARGVARSHAARVLISQMLIRPWCFIINRIWPK